MSFKGILIYIKKELFYEFIKNNVNYDFVIVWFRLVITFFLFFLRVLVKINY